MLEKRGSNFLGYFWDCVGVSELQSWNCGHFFDDIFDT